MCYYCQNNQSLTLAKFKNNAKNGSEESDDEEERFVDVKSDDDDDDADKDEHAKLENKNSWIHKKNSQNRSHDVYDYTQRNPLYSGADKTLTYELLLFQKHYHPTVTLFANRLMNVIY